MTRALNSVSEEYRSTAASLVTVSRMIGMALGLAALSAWGVEQFQILTAGLELPIPIPGETAEALQAGWPSIMPGLMMRDSPCSTTFSVLPGE